MSRFETENEALAREIVSRYPRPKSATIPLCHLAQEQDGYLSDEAMGHIAELVGVTPAEVRGTATFYEMFKLDPVGRYVINVCTNISCQLLGGEELLEHASSSLGIAPGSTTADGLFTLEDVECIAACTEAPACQVNYRYLHQVSAEEFDELIDDLRAGRRAGIPDHGTLGSRRQVIPAGRLGGIEPPEGQSKVDPLDSYALRLATARRMYDQGTIVQAAGHLAGLAGPAQLRVSGYDFDRLGVAAGSVVRATSSTGSIDVGVIADDGVPRGVAVLDYNRAGADARALFDHEAVSIDVRLETVS